MEIGVLMTAILDIILDFFTKFFDTSEPSELMIDEVLSFVDPLVMTR